ncbi:hypothetical protein RclHR1_11340001 [Rhizophagus clarus]|nr:hypothetical protein RclHR1_11340001 [Rhizophagus clarus]
MNRKTKSTNASLPNKSSTGRRSAKKVATRANNIPLNNSRGQASQQQYSSSTNNRQASRNSDSDSKKSKSKLKRSSTSKKAILAEITRMNGVLEMLLKRTTI